MIRLVLSAARNGTEVVYMPGNRDEALRACVGHEIAGVRLLDEAVHVGADGRRCLVIHGDRFDSVVRCAAFLAHLGDSAYSVTLRANRWFNEARRRLGYPYWSLSQWLSCR